MAVVATRDVGIMPGIQQMVPLEDRERLEQFRFPLRPVTQVTVADEDAANGDAIISSLNTFERAT